MCDTCWCATTATSFDATPAALQHVSGCELASVVRLLLLNSKDPAGSDQLLRLPGARSLDISQLCSLLRLAMATRATHVMTGLAE
jgi:hypothetical protein